MTNTENFKPNHLAAVASVLVVAVLAGLVVFVLGAIADASRVARSAEALATVERATVPVPPGVRVDVASDGADVLDCLLDMGYDLHGSRVQVTPADREWCRAAV